MNAKEEFLRATKESGLKIEWAEIHNCQAEEGDEGAVSNALYHGYTEQELDAFLEAINFEYDNGYGGQELFGFVGLSGGAWLERYEYDGAERWEFKEYPEAPVRPS